MEQEKLEAAREFYKKQLEQYLTIEEQKAQMGQRLKGLEEEVVVMKEIIEILKVGKL